MTRSITATELEAWTKQAEGAGTLLHAVPGKVVGVCVDDSFKADWFVEFWRKHHPHVRIIDRDWVEAAKTYVIRIRKANQHEH